MTTKRLPNVKHLGNIFNISGGEIEPVDIITFGSPCQDLSIAGKKQGLDGSRSSLFFEAIRIIKEMRKATNDKYPRFIIWENVPGTFSSNQGNDFRQVLESICRVKDTTISVPEPPKKWTKAGSIVGDDYSVAWRTFDAQYWGVPQRRKRIYLVADFNGGGASKILHEPNHMQNSIKKSREIQQNSTNRNEKSPNFETYGINIAFHLVINKNKSPTLCCTPSTGVSYFDRTASKYIIRYLTPKECGKLQGFPDDWADNLGMENPTDNDLIFWRKVFKDCNRPKTDKQIIKWLKNPYSDTQAYAMWGNGIALPNAVYIFEQIAFYERNNNE